MAELERLDLLARSHGVPLIIDAAYGAPFPAIQHAHPGLLWNANVVLCLSLSKLGLPATRTGIVVARRRDHRGADRLQCDGCAGARRDGSGPRRAAVAQWRAAAAVRRGDPPHYAQRCDEAIDWLQGVRRTCRCKSSSRKAHSSSGSGFRACRSRARSSTGDSRPAACWCCPVIISFRGWSTAVARTECLRINYSQPPENVRAGIAIIAEEVRLAYA